MITEDVWEFNEKFDVPEDTIIKIYEWMDENAGDYTTIMELAEGAMAEFEIEWEEYDDNFFYELAEYNWAVNE